MMGVMATQNLMAILLELPWCNYGIEAKKKVEGHIERFFVEEGYINQDVW